MSNVEDAERALVQAEQAFARFDADAAVAQLSAAIRGFTAAGEQTRAAMACVRLGQTYENALGNLTAARAWFARATRLIEHEPPCVEQGWVAVAAMGCDVDDPAALLAAAELALERARRFGDVNLETKALADAGLAHVQAGRTAQGMALLDEAMALACGPANDSGAAAKSVCSFFTACYYAADFARASSWSAPLRRQGLIGPERGAALFLSNHCDSVEARLLLELGRWGDAEAVLLRTHGAFESAMGMPAWHSAIALADLRVRQARLGEAEALLLGRDQSVDALLPAAQLHLARGEAELARAAASRGLRVLGADRLRAIELLIVQVDAALALGDAQGAECAAQALSARAQGLTVETVAGRAAAAQGRVLAARGEHRAAIALLEPIVDELDPARAPWLRALLLLELARQREHAGDRAAAQVEARSAAGILAGLDVVLGADDAALLARLLPRAVEQAAPPAPLPSALLDRDGKWWSLACGGTSLRLPDTKGLRYLALLIAQPGVEHHALDLVDRIEGVDLERSVDRRALSGRGPLLDARARSEYRARIEVLRTAAAEALELGRLEAAEAAQVEIEQLVRQLAQAFGLGGRERDPGSAAERARLNVTRALRAAIAKLGEALPEAGGGLDRQVRTGLYCGYFPENDAVRWAVHTPLNEPPPP